MAISTAINGSMSVDWGRPEVDRPLLSPADIKTLQAAMREKAKAD
jgi:hypothetical protein